jgi:ATP-dependent Clp protease ATP-binding subunit ClpC
LRWGGVVLHSEEIERMEAVLTKQKESGVMLVGEPGCGRKSIIYNFANMVFTESVPHALDKMRIMELDLPKLTGECSDKSTLAFAIEKIFEQAAAAKNVILVIPEINNYLGQHLNSEKLVQMDIGDILSKYLEIPGFRIIGITTYEGLHRSIEMAGDVSLKMAKIEVAPVSAGEAMRVLKEDVLRREADSNLFISMPVLKEIVRLCDNFLGEAAFPKKAVDFLDDFIASRLGRAKAAKTAIVPEDIAAFFSRKYSIPAGAAGFAEKDILLNLEQKIHEGLINQKEAVAEIANAMRRARAEIKKQKRTIGNFLFLGPTGVGKTETAKQLARVYFGSVKNIIRLNMTEYQTIESIEKLIGTAFAPGYLTAAVRENPFSLLLIDEIEKADIRLLDIFLSIFDEGQIVDGLGRKIDFRHIIIIATSNAGAEAIRQAVASGRSLSDLKNEIVDGLLKDGIFKPEFINRFDAVVMYRPLNQVEMEKVANLLLVEVQSGLREKRIEFLITDELRAGLAKIGFDPEFGGRALRRALQDKVENPIAKALLSGTLKSGDKFEINSDNWELKIATR